jgi:hypothetical protein
LGADGYRFRKRAAKRTILPQTLRSIELLGAIRTLWIARKLLRASYPRHECKKALEKAALWRLI